MSTQSKIDIEANGLRILGMLKRFQTKSADETDTVRGALDRVIRDGLLWTAKMIALQLSGMPEETAVEALQLLLKRGHVEHGRNDQWFITFEGRKAYEEEMNSRLMVNESKWKSEVSEGGKEETRTIEVLSPDGKSSRKFTVKRFVPTQIVNPVLTSNSATEGFRENNVERRTVEQCASIERARHIAFRHSMTVEETLEKIRTGEIHRCRVCGLENPFHRKNAANGQQWQSICIECHRKQKARGK